MTDFYVTPSEDALDQTADTMLRRGAYDDRYEAINELREADRHLLTPSVEDAARANGFFRVASFQGPLLDLAKLLDADFMKDKRKFYAFLGKHPELCTYDRRKNARPTQITNVDGKSVL